MMGVRRWSVSVSVEQKKRAPSYFIQVDSYWANSPDRFVGPFDSRAAAQEAIDAIETSDNVWLSTSTCGGDIRDAVRVYPHILTFTEARRAGLCCWTLGDSRSNLLGKRIPRSLPEMHLMEDGVAARY